jgi:hypothetical protein
MAVALKCYLSVRRLRHRTTNNFLLKRCSVPGNGKYLIKHFDSTDGYGIEHLGLKVPADSDRRPLKEIMNETDYEYIDAPSNVQ